MGVPLSDLISPDKLLALQSLVSDLPADDRLGTLATEQSRTIDVQEAKAELAELELKMAHEPLGIPGNGTNWVEQSGQLPAYIQHIAKDIAEKRGEPLSSAIPIAIGAVKRWARGGGNVNADTRAKAAAAVAEWEALKAKNKARMAAKDTADSGKKADEPLEEKEWSEASRGAALAARRAHEGGHTLVPHPANRPGHQENYLVHDATGEQAGEIGKMAMGGKWVAKTRRGIRVGVFDSQEEAAAAVAKRHAAAGAADKGPGLMGGSTLGKADDEELEVKGPEQTGDMEHKAAGPGTAVLSTDDSSGVVEAIVSVTGVADRVDDIIEPGAYTSTLAKHEPIGVWSHDDKTWVARAEEVKELLPGDPSLPKTLQNGEPWPTDAGALYVKSRFNLDTPHGAAAFSDVKFFQGKTGWSIGYRVTNSKRDVRTGVRRIKSLNLYEFSPVMVGAAPQSMTLSVKSLSQPVDADDVPDVPELLDALEVKALLDARAALETKNGHHLFGSHTDKFRGDHVATPAGEYRHHKTGTPLTVHKNGSGLHHGTGAHWPAEKVAKAVASGEYRLHAAHKDIGEELEEKGRFIDALHPRNHGKFASKPGAGAEPKAPAAERVLAAAGSGVLPAAPGVPDVAAPPTYDKGLPDALKKLIPAKHHLHALKHSQIEAVATIASVEIMSMFADRLGSGLISGQHAGWVAELSTAAVFAIHKSIRAHKGGLFDVEFKAGAVVPEPDAAPDAAAPDAAPDGPDDSTAMQAIALLVNDEIDNLPADAVLDDDTFNQLLNAVAARLSDALNSVGASAGDDTADTATAAAPPMTPADTSTKALFEALEQKIHWTEHLHPRAHGEFAPKGTPNMPKGPRQGPSAAAERSDAALVQDAKVGGLADELHAKAREAFHKTALSRSQTPAQRQGFTAMADGLLDAEKIVRGGGGSAELGAAAAQAKSEGKHPMHVEALMAAAADHHEATNHMDDNELNALASGAYPGEQPMIEKVRALPPEQRRGALREAFGVKSSFIDELAELADGETKTETGEFQTEDFDLEEKDLFTGSAPAQTTSGFGGGKTQPAIIGRTMAAADSAAKKVTPKCPHCGSKSVTLIGGRKCAMCGASVPGPAKIGEPAVLVDQKSDDDLLARELALLLGVDEMEVKAWSSEARGAAMATHRAAKKPAPVAEPDMAERQKLATAKGRILALNLEPGHHVNFTKSGPDGPETIDGKVDKVEQCDDMTHLSIGGKVHKLPSMAPIMVKNGMKADDEPLEEKADGDVETPPVQISEHEILAASRLRLLVD